jgi:hypothetical protein
MPKRSSTKRNHFDGNGKDINETAFSIVQQATGQTEKLPEFKPPVTRTLKEKNAAAVSLGRLGGLKGGKARAKALSPAKRKAIAKKAARARWKS